jgi:predicted aldo/keto reductase-like oxidoreductase
MNRTELSSQDMKLLKIYSQETRSGYCAGCTNHCESAMEGTVPIGDVMRYLMYSRSYGDRDRATRRFNRIPERIRSEMAERDYTLAEQKCPQNIAIGKLMREALNELNQRAHSPSAAGGLRG